MLPLINPLIPRPLRRRHLQVRRRCLARRRWPRLRPHLPLLEDRPPSLPRLQLNLSLLQLSRLPLRDSLLRLQLSLSLLGDNPGALTLLRRLVGAIPGSACGGAASRKWAARMVTLASEIGLGVVPTGSKAVPRRRRRAPNLCA